MSCLCLERIYYPVLTLGYGKRLGVWVRGCGRGCPGCISPQLQTYGGRRTEVSDIIKSLPASFQADGLTISGGEPFDQTEGIAELVNWFADHISEDILIYTGYTLEELKQRHDRKTEDILSRTAVLVDGPYIETLNDGCGLRGSSNQRVIVSRFFDRYKDAGDQERQVQFVGETDSLLQIGIPPIEGQNNS